jgi:DNA recombination protein RmuC
MENAIIAVLAVGLLLAVAAILRKKDKSTDEVGLKLLLEQINELSRMVDRKMGETTKHVSESIQTQLRESGKLIKDVTESLTKLDETNRQVVSFADQLQNLQDILRNPKQRGVLGEYYLETLLKNVLPPGQYKMQYAFSNGEIVDAVVMVKNKIIPIDSKFSLENYNRLIDAKDPSEKGRLEKIFVNDLKLRITETSKYIRPAEGTMDFAFMFIPHEAIYYDLLINRVGGIAGEDTENLMQRAAGKYNVIIVSPTSFLAYLQTVLQGLKAMQIEETAKDIIKRIGELGVHLKKYEEFHNKLGNSLDTTVNHFNAGSREFKKVDKDIMRITGTAVGLETPLVDKTEDADL